MGKARTWGYVSGIEGLAISRPVFGGVSSDPEPEPEEAPAGADEDDADADEEDEAWPLDDEDDSATTEEVGVEIGFFTPSVTVVLLASPSFLLSTSFP